MSKQKNQCTSLKWETRDSSSLEVRNFLRCHFFEIEMLEYTDSVRLQNQPVFTILLMKSTEGQFQSSYQPAFHLKFKNALIQFEYFL